MPAAIESGGSLVWPARVRSLPGQAVSMHAVVYVPVTATSGSLTITVKGHDGNPAHVLTINSSGALSASAQNTALTTRTTTYTETNQEQRFVPYGVHFPANYIGGGAVSAALYFPTNGSWAPATATPGADPGGTHDECNGQVEVVNGMDARVLVAALYVWAGDGPDANPEFRTVSLDNTAANGYVGLIFKAKLRDDYVDSVSGDAATATSATLVNYRGAPEWVGVEYHVALDLDPSMENTVGVLNSIQNRAMTGDNWVNAAGSAGGEIVDSPFGRCAYIGEQPGLNDDATWNSPTNSPILHSHYSVVSMVLGSCGSPGTSSIWRLLQASAGIKLQLLNLNRFGDDGIAYDANHRSTMSPSALTVIYDGSPMTFYHGTWDPVTHASYAPAAASSSTLSIGVAPGSNTTNARLWLWRIVAFDGVPTPEKAEEFHRYMSSRHNCREYVAGYSNILVAEGQSSIVGTQDYRRYMGFVGRMALYTPRNTIFFQCGTGSQDFTNHDADRNLTVRYIAAVLCPGAVQSDFVGQMGGNDMANGMTGAAALGEMTDYLNTGADAVSNHYDRIYLLQLHPRDGSPTAQATFAAEAATFNAGLAGIANVDRVFPTYFTNFGVGGDWSSNPTYYVESPAGVHGNGAFFDLYMSAGGYAGAFFSEFSEEEDQGRGQLRTPRLRTG